MIGIRRRGIKRVRMRRSLLKGVNYAGKLIRDELITAAGVGAIGYGASKLRSRYFPSKVGSFKNKSVSVLPSLNKLSCFKIKDKDIDKTLSRASSASKTYQNISHGTRNLAHARKEAALAHRYETENTPLDRNIRRVNRVVNTADTARRSAQSLGLIKRRRNPLSLRAVRYRVQRPFRRVSAGLRLLRMITR